MQHAIRLARVICCADSIAGWKVEAVDPMTAKLRQE
jgi:hypothetical protein